MAPAPTATARGTDRRSFYPGLRPRVHAWAARPARGPLHQIATTIFFSISVMTDPHSKSYMNNYTSHKMLLSQHLHTSAPSPFNLSHLSYYINENSNTINRYLLHSIHPKITIQKTKTSHINHTYPYTSHPPKKKKQKNNG